MIRVGLWEKIDGLKGEGHHRNGRGQRRYDPMKENGRSGLWKARTAGSETGISDTPPPRVLLKGVLDGTDDGRTPRRKCPWGEAHRDGERAQEIRPAGQPIAGTGPICVASTDSRVQRYENLLHHGIPINGDSFERMAELVNVPKNSYVCLDKSGLLELLSQMEKYNWLHYEWNH